MKRGHHHGEHHSHHGDRRGERAEHHSHHGDRRGECGPRAEHHSHHGDRRGECGERAEHHSHHGDRHGECGPRAEHHSHHGLLSGLQFHQSSFFEKVLNFKTPYVCSVPGRLTPGKALLFQGVLSLDAKVFEINLRTGQSSADDIAFQFKLHGGQKVTLNSFRNGKWESEESASDKPFIKGVPFIMYVVIKAEGYEVYVNGFQHCFFKHRLPLEKVSAMEICGDVNMHVFNFIDNWSIAFLSSMGNISTTASEISFPVSNPKLPYVGPISGGVKPGMAVYFQGIVPQTANHFEINFKTGQSNGDDNAFNFKPTFGQKVTLNSFRKGVWETEESVSDKPFTKGSAFTVIFVIKADGYEVNVNGFPHCAFKHRIPLEKVSAVEIRGDVTINVFGFIQDWSTCSFFKELKSIPPRSVPTTHLEISHAISNAKIPYLGPISGGMRPGMALYFQGLVLQEAKHFEINLKTGQLNSDDTAFQFKPCFGQKVTMNSFSSNSWGSEESASDKPFTKGAAFTLVLLIRPESYEVYVNGLQHYMFKHRIPLEKVTAIGINGDVTMNTFGVIENWYTSSFFMGNFQSEMAQSVLKPAIPCVNPLSGGIRPGMALCVQGVVPVEAQAFEINLQTGPSNDQDRAFHFKPCIGQRVVLNSFRNGKWESEESAPDKPFTKGSTFTMFLVVTAQGYEVYANGFQHCKFKHRIPLEKVNTLMIGGDVSVNMLGTIENWRTSSFFLSNFQSEMVRPVFKPAIPYMSPLSGGIRPGMTLCFQGIVSSNAKQFIINLQAGPSNTDDLKAFHFNPRIGQRVVLNSFRNGKWESEESAPDKPFTKGATFTMFLVVTAQGYEVYVNGLKHCTFKHRIPLEKVTTLTISGDVSMNLFGVIQNWETSSVFLSNFQSDMKHPVLKPAVPCVSPLDDGLQPGMALCFQGFIPVTAKEFEINLQTGPSNDQDRAFHFKPCIGQRVVLNSFRNGKWESEESAPDKPFTKGSTFTMFLVVTAQGYEVYANGFQHCKFKHRIPLEKVNTLMIGGDVSVNMLGTIENWRTSSFFLSNFQSEMVRPVLKPAVPCVSPLADGLQPGMALCFQGFIPVTAKEFEINLQTGPSNDQDRAFHFKPCIGQRVVLNSFRNGKWESEESAPDKPFTKGSTFTMFLVVTAQGYEVYANGFQHCKFKHRIPLEKVNTLMIGGDVSVNMLGTIENWRTSSFFLSNFQSEMVRPVLKPAVPCVSPLADGLQPGMALCFQGFIPVTAKEFEINLQTGPSNDQDRAFHFKPCIGQRVVLNSFRNGKWESEESAPDKPFTKGSTFTMFLVVTAQGYEVYANGFQHCKFKHRIPLEKVNTLMIGGDVSVNMLGTIENWRTSSFFLSNFQSEMVRPVLKPAVPCVSPLADGLQPGMALCFQGFIPVTAKEFEINLQTGPSNDQDRAFHFKPCIGQRVVLNSFRNGKWESEESAPDKPFTKGSTFTMFLVVTAQGYEVYANGFQHCKFKHRIPLEKVNTLMIGGDVSVNMLGTIENWRTSSFFLSNFQSEMFRPVLKPAVPCVSPLADGLQPGMALCFQGFIPVTAKEFEINLQTGPSNDQDRAFHFKPCIGQRVVLNSFRNGKWESEESAPDKPFTKGSTFTMFLVVTAQGYEVYANGFQHCKFKHRIPLEKVNTLMIGGDVSVNMLGTIENWRTSSFFLSNFQSEMVRPVLKPAVPCVSPLADGLQPGMALCFQGFIPVTAKEFEINLQTGPSNDQDRAFHFKPCIGQRVVLNSFRNGKWESEESAPDKPFTKGSTFNMFLVVTAQGYEVYANGFQHCKFKHRIPLEKVNTLMIGGDVSVNMLGTIENWRTSSFFLSNFQSEMVRPVLKPAVPCVSPLADGLQPGMALCFQGFIPVTAKEFEINLQTGPSNDQDRAFHFKPCIGQRVVLNSFRNGKWESEESAPDKPFTKGSTFTMFLVVTAQGYEVYANGFQHCKFKHRIPLEKVNTLMIGGDVSVNMLGTIENWRTSSFFLSNFQSEMVRPVLKPAVPCVSPLADGLQPGMALCFQGFIPVTAKEFEINLQTGPSNDQDRAFHFKPCIGQRVVLNSFRNGKWESEESAPDKPFTKGSTFTMFLVVTAQGYEVYANGFQHCKFKHRIPLEKVNTLMIGGDVSVNMLGTIENWRTSSFFLSNFQSEMVRPVLKPAVPCVSPLADGLQPGMALCFQGFIPVTAKEFEINLQTGPSNDQERAFHFKPCIGQRVVLNSFRNGKWESEESAPDKPFTKGSTFTMFLVVTVQGYEVYVNGLQHCTFKHRIPLEKVTTLTISGDVSINILGTIESWKTSSFFMYNMKSEQFQSVLKPTIPYVSPVSGEIRPDVALCFTGAVPVDAKQFSINLKTGPSNEDDVAFQFKPCIGQKVTLNSFRNGKWESEESAPVEPFAKGSTFTMFVIITAEGYEVYVNGLKHCMFKHSIPVENVSTLDLRGDVSMHVLGYINKWSSSFLFRELQKIPGVGSSTTTLKPIQIDMSHPVTKPAIPYVGSIPERIKPDMAVCFQGTVPPNSDQFSINLKTGPSNEDDVAFQFKPCIGQKVTLNSFRNGKWESEESAPVEPFAKGSTFTMFLVITAEGYEVYVNGLKHCMFKHRIPVENVSTLDLRGDVSMHVLGYINKWSSSSLFRELQKIPGVGSSATTLKPIQIDMSHPVTKPAIPYVGSIPERIKPDMAVCFQGTVPPNSDQFSINLKTGPSNEDDVAFQFKPCIGQKVTLNSFRNGKWESEESAPVEPFTKGSTFTMFLVITAEGYEVYVNGLKHCMFKHRIPVENVSTLDLRGDVSMHVLGYINKWSSSSLFRELQKIPGVGSSASTLKPIQIDMSHPVTKPAIPYVGSIPERIKPDMAVCFQGTVPPNSDQFSINLKTGPSNEDDVAFQFKPCIGQKVTLNSFRNGKWESEESAPVEPFAKGSTFTMFLVITAEGYEVYVNGLKHCMFKHRIPVENVSTLDLRGDVSMHVLGYINKWSSSSIFPELQNITRIESSSCSMKPVQIDVSHPVTNPAIPYVGSIPERIKPDMAVCFQGTVPPNSDQFSINLKTGPSNEDDVAFQFKPCIGQKVTLNSFRNGKWESEESAPVEPFTKGSTFTMFLVITAEGYEVYVNGLKHCMFKHRIPVENVSTLDLRGDVSMHVLGYINKWSSSSIFPELQNITRIESSSCSMKPVQIDVSHPVTNPAIPYVGSIPERIKPDMAVCFQGTVPPNSDQFSINLKTGPSNEDDVAFQFKPCIGQKVTLNSFRNGKWESEESAPVEPFTKGSTFTMFLVITAEGYEVYVNGLKHCMFKHRIPVENVSTLDLRGDVSMHVLGYINKWSSSSIFPELQNITRIESSSCSMKPVQIDVSHPVTKPAIPYVGSIPERIKPDMAVCFQGTVPPNSDQFSINLKTGPSNEDDVAFQFKPCIGQKVTLNSFRNGKWESEESAPVEPFTKGSTFTMFLVITAEGYEVYVNGVKHCMFKHRIPVENVSTLDLRGDVSMHVLGYIKKWSSSSIFPELQNITHIESSSCSIKPVQIDVSHPVTDPAIPYVGTIPDGIKMDMAVYLQGTVPANCNQFSINLKTGPSNEDDVAFQFKPCIGQKVTLNSFRNGKWESEESAPVEPFTKGSTFTMFLVITAEGYEVYVNGLKHCMFKHRIPVENVSTLDLRGDVSMHVLGYIKKWSSSSIFPELQNITHIESSSCSIKPVQIDVSHPVTDPAIPYVGTIPDGIKMDMAVYLQGTVPANCNQFSINLKTGPSNEDDVAFQFKPCIGQKVTLNSFRNGKWESEESAPVEPFTKGSTFTMFLIITAEGYEVYVNGLKHCMFKHRIPVENVSTLDLRGDVSMHVLGYIKKWSSSSIFPELQNITRIESSSCSMKPVQIDVSHPVTDPAIPYVGTIPDGIKMDMAVYLQGTVPANCNQFSINLKTGPSNEDDVAFQFKPCIGQKVTLNSFRNGKWESEESAPVEPFTKGSTFTMFLVITAEGYEVYVNGLKHCMFKHRIPVVNVSTLDLRGDVSMHVLGYIKKWSSSSIFPELQNITHIESSSCSIKPVQIDVSHPVTDPAIPYVGTIPDGIKMDMAVYLQGTVPANCNQFSINLKTGPSNEDDVAFQFKPCIGQKVTLNSFRNGKWESEESAPVEPFTKGSTFTMFLVITAEGYEVYVNGLKHCMFKHRIPVENVSTLDLRGDVSMHVLGYIKKWSSSSIFPELQNITRIESSSCSMKPVQIDVSHPVTNPAIPYVGTIPDGIKMDMAVYLQGTVPANCNQFSINLKTGPSNEDDVAFQFKPCIGQKVTLNSFRNGKWESEESAPVEPFTKGSTFTMFLVITAEGYEVYVNGLKHCMFKHRIPVENVSTLDLRGDVSMHVLGYINKWISSSFVMEEQVISEMESSSCSLIELEVSHPVCNPAIPYVGTIPEKLKPDMGVCLNGTVPANSDQFSINLKTGPSNEDDVAFQFKPCIGEKVTLNSFRNGKWESEESAPVEPFTKGGAFSVFIAITAEGYEVNVNGMELCMFKHRVPLEKVSVLNITGNVSIDMVGFVMNWSKAAFSSQQVPI